MCRRLGLRDLKGFGFVALTCRAEGSGCEVLGSFSLDHCQGIRCSYHHGDHSTYSMGSSYTFGNEGVAAQAPGLGRGKGSDHQVIPHNLS